MEIELFTHVHIIDKNVNGVVVDTRAKKDGTKVYVVESDEIPDRPDPDSYPSLYPLFDCLSEQLQII